MTDELRTQFHSKIGELHQQVQQLMELVRQGAVGSVEVLLGGDTSISDALMTRELLVEELYQAAEVAIQTEIALQAPVARDLRMLLAMLRIVPELERSHDLCEHVARRSAGGLGRELSPRIRELVTRMGAIDDEMWGRVGDAFSTWSDIVDELDQRDDELDELHVSLVAEIASGAVALPVALEMVLVGRFLERIGDHAVNVARRIRVI
jgi:phosphate transport system protein